MSTFATMNINIVANAAQYVATMARVKAQAITTSGAMGAVAGVAGLAVVAGLAKATKAAIDWEDAMAGVKRTVNLTNEQLESGEDVYGQIEADLRALTKVIPIAHAEMAEMAETAGALGVPAESISEFVRVAGTISQLSDDLDPGQTATAIGKIRTVMGLATTDFNRFGSAMVALGVSGASTEAEILKMAQRASGAFGALDISVPNLLGWSAAMANVGEKSEAGGTSLQRLGGIIQKHILDGGDKLDVVANAAAMTSKAFGEMFDDDASLAMQRYINGLALMDKNTRAISLRDASFIDIRLVRGLNKIINAVSIGLEGNLNDALVKSNEAWQENTMLTKVAAERWSTTSKQFVIFSNKVRDFAITLGGALLPAVSLLIQLLSGLMDILGGLTVAFPGLTAAITPLIGVLGALLAMRFGAKMLAMLLPTSGAGTAIATKWAAVSAMMSAGITGSIGRMGLLVTGAMKGVIAAFGLAGAAAGLAFKLAALGVFALLLLQIERMATELIDKIEKLNAQFEEVRGKVRTNAAHINTLDIDQLIAERTRLNEELGNIGHLKLLADFADPEIGHSLENQIEQIDDLLAAADKGPEAFAKMRGSYVAEAAKATQSIDDMADGFERLRRITNKGVIGSFGGGFDFDSFDGSLGELQQIIGKAKIDAVTAIRDLWKGIRQALAKPPKFISDKKRIKGMDKTISKISGMIKKSIKKDDSLSQEYWSGQLIMATNSRRSFKGMNNLSKKETVALFRDLNIKVPKFLRKVKTGAKTGAQGVVDATKNMKERAEGITMQMDGTAGGANFSSTVATGIRSGIPDITAAANEAAAAAGEPFAGQSPPKVGPLRHIDRDGKTLMKTLAGGILSQRTMLSGVAGQVAGTLTPRPMGVVAMGAMGGARRGGGDTHFHIGTLIADEVGLDELDKRQGRRKKLKNRKRRSNSSPNG